MDYIAEKLRRQREVWYALLDAAAPKKTGEKPKRRPPSPLPSPAAEAAKPGGARPFAPPERTETRRGARLRPEVSRLEAEADTAEIPDGAAAAAASAAAAAERRALRTSLSRRSALRRQRFAPLAGEEAGQETVSVSPAVFREPLLRAREISRTVERDARRYDGAFSPF